MAIAPRRRQMELNEAISSVGGFGIFQKVMMCLLCPVAMFQGARMTANFFLLFNQEHRCKIPDDANDTSYTVHGYIQHVLYNRSIPEGDSCRVFDPNKTFEYDDFNRPINGTTVSCTGGYLYDKTEMVLTATEELNMVCGDSMQVSYINILLYLGSLVGSTGLGYVADRFGRKKCFLLCVFLYLASGIALAWSPNFAALGVFEFVSGAASTGMSANAFVMGLELVEPEHRKMPGMFYILCFSLGEIVTGGVAYGLKHWKWIDLVITIPAVLFVAYFWIVPESLRWLMLHRKLDEIARILERIARWNNRSLPTQAGNREEMARLLESVHVPEEEADGYNVVQVATRRKDSFWDVFKSGVLALRVSIIFINWLVIMTVFYGFIFNSDNLVYGNVYLNFALGALVEIPAHLMTFCLIDKIGRKALHCAYLSLATLASAAAIGVIFKAGQEHQWVVLMLSCIGKYGAAGLTGTSFMWTTELFPTSIRSTGLGISNSFGRIGALITTSLIIPQTRAMDSDLGQALPFIVFGAASFVNVLLVLLLPETLMRHLPDNIEEAKHFGRAVDDVPQAEVAHRPSYGSQGHTVQRP